MVVLAIELYELSPKSLHTLAKTGRNSSRMSLVKTSLRYFVTKTKCTCILKMQ